MNQNQISNWCTVKYYLDGNQHLPHLDFSMELGYDSFANFIGSRPYNTFHYHREPAEIKLRTYKTPYLVYDGVILERTPENELEFLKIESDLDSKYKEFWKLYVRFDDSCSDNTIKDYVDHVGTFFNCDYDDNLSKLIKLHVLNGWHRLEVVNSIQKLLRLKLEDVQIDNHWEKIEWLRVTVNQNPEILNQLEAA
ncbi:MAG: hypothetical protein PUP92_26790 [Rhizonema sp. PD38]|nr:hypothetical protein [Rhizonema sp. PD38]